MVRQRSNVVVRSSPNRINRPRPMFYGGPDPITLNKMQGLVNNVRSLSSEFLDRIGHPDPSQDRRRDLDDECGYPKHQWSAEEYKDLIDREPLAALLNEFEALESWSVLPDMWEDDDEGVETDFEIAWNELPSMMGAEPSYFDAGDMGTDIWSLLLLADIHCGEGRHGVIVLGLDDGKEMYEPATPRKGMKLQWARSFPEYLCRVTQFDMDPKSPRYRMPMAYDITFSDPRESSGSGITESYTTESVHWSRCIHVCDRWHAAPTSLNFAVPRLRPVRDPVLDYRKVRGASAEMYWKAAFVGLHFGTHPQLGADVFVDTDSLKDMMEEYWNGLQRAVYTNGMSVDQLAPGVVDPTPQLLAQIQPICMVKRVPMRILLGSERGELASGDDKIKWNNRMRSRQRWHNTNGVIVPFTNRLINLGVLPTPKKYKLWWPDLASQTEEERVKILLTRTQCYKEYVVNDLESMIPRLDYMTKFDNLETEEAEEMIEEVEAIQEEQAAEAQALADEMGLEPDLTEEGFKKPDPDPDEEQARAIELEKVKAKAKVTKNAGESEEDYETRITIIAVSNCGGPGSGKPGPCPSPHSDLKRTVTHQGHSASGPLVDKFMDGLNSGKYTSPSHEEIGNVLTRKDKAKWIYDNGKDIVGATSFSLENGRKEVHIHDMGSLQKGLGSKMVSDLSGMVRGVEGGKVVAKNVRPEAKGFYNKLGFKDQGNDWVLEVK